MKLSFIEKCENNLSEKRAKKNWSTWNVRWEWRCRQSIDVHVFANFASYVSLQMRKKNFCLCIWQRTIDKIPFISPEGGGDGETIAANSTQTIFNVRWIIEREFVSFLSHSVCAKVLSLVFFQFDSSLRIDFRSIHLFHFQHIFALFTLHYFFFVFLWFTLRLFFSFFSSFLSLRIPNFYLNEYTIMEFLVALSFCSLLNNATNQSFHSFLFLFLLSLRNSAYHFFLSFSSLTLVRHHFSTDTFDLWNDWFE